MSNLKKFLPIILFALGILVLVLVFVFVKKGKEPVTDETNIVTEVALSDRPFASLTPSSDGHYLTLKIEKITLSKVASLDYELLYTLPDGRTQGVPGTVDLKGTTEIERKLLLGSESSGKFRYDEGVEEGSLTVRYRDSKGKLLAKFSTKFHFQSTDLDLTSVDGVFTYTLENKPKGMFFVTMETFGFIKGGPESVTSGPYGIFASDDLPAGSAEGWQIIDTNIFYK